MSLRGSVIDGMHDLYAAIDTSDEQVLGGLISLSSISIDAMMCYMLYRIARDKQYWLYIAMCAFYLGRFAIQ